MFSDQPTTVPSAFSRTASRTLLLVCHGDSIVAGSNISRVNVLGTLSFFVQIEPSNAESFQHSIRFSCPVDLKYYSCSDI